VRVLAGWSPRWRSPFGRPRRRSSTRGARISTGPEPSVTLRAWALPLRATGTEGSLQERCDGIGGERKVSKGGGDNLPDSVHPLSRPRISCAANVSNSLRAAEQFLGGPLEMDCQSLPSVVSETPFNSPNLAKIRHGFVGRNKKNFARNEGHCECSRLPSWHCGHVAGVNF